MAGRGPREESPRRKIPLRGWVRRLLGRTWPRPPAAWNQRVGGGDFREIGRDLLERVRELAGLERDHRILDLGCGPGRLVEPLRRWLGPAGSYEGLDIVPEFIRWNQHHVTPVDPRFRFRFADLRNDAYHRGGGSAEAFVFPYPDAAFDRVVAASLFTHLEAATALHYLVECRRVLKPGGRLFATFFLLDDGVRERIAAGKSCFAFGWPAPYGAVEDPRQPEFAVAFERWALAGGLEHAGLRPVAPPWPGRWSGVDGPHFQDVAVAERPAQPRSPG
jgi:SAM-dependent methyltransferase